MRKTKMNVIYCRRRVSFDFHFISYFLSVPFFFFVISEIALIESKMRGL